MRTVRPAGRHLLDNIKDVGVRLKRLEQWAATQSPVGGPSPASTVTGPDAFGSPAVVGTSLLYARADHDHGLPASSGFSSPPTADGFYENQTLASISTSLQISGGSGTPGCLTRTLLFIPGGITITKIAIATAGAANVATPDHSWIALTTKANPMTVLAASADQISTPLPTTSTLWELSLSSAYIIPASGLYYVVTNTHYTASAWTFDYAGSATTTWNASQGTEQGELSSSPFGGINGGPPASIIGAGVSFSAPSAQIAWVGVQ